MLVAAPRPAPVTSRADSLVQFALAQRGTPYVYAGTQPATGFDCSGFIHYVFGHFHLDTPHSTALLIDVGQPVPRAQARPGDIVVFTGTAATSTTPGHAGIVISALGEVPLRHRLRAAVYAGAPRTRAGRPWAGGGSGQAATSPGSPGCGSAHAAARYHRSCTAPTPTNASGAAACGPEASNSARGQTYCDKSNQGEKAA